MSGNQYPLLGPATSQQSSWSLGSDLSFSSPSPAFASVNPTSKAASDFFGVASSRDLMRDVNTPRPVTLTDFLRQGEPNASQSVGNLILDLGANMTHLDQVKGAYDMGKTLHDTSKSVRESPCPLMETAVCKVAKVGAEIAYGAVGTTVLLEGTALLIAESIAFPPLAAAIPVAGAALPQAYANVQALATFAGNKAEADCHLLFSGKE